MIGTLFYAHSLVTQLRETRIFAVKLFYAEYYTNAEKSLIDSLTDDYHYAQSSDVPSILTDRHDNPLSGILTRRIETYRKIPHWIRYNRLRICAEEMREMDQVYHPISFYFHDSAQHQDVVTGYIHYGNSLVLSKIESLPYVQLLLGLVVVVIGYLSFSYLKRSEQSNIWVGMAKETAHQLGTPLSSLLGWAEMLRLSSTEPKEVETISWRLGLVIEC